MSIFSSIKANRPKRTAFNLSHEVKMTSDMGRLTPFMCREVVPGDTFSAQAEIMLRMAPMIAPIMHRVNVYTYFFFVPNRLIWNEWEEFITGGPDGQSMPVFPTIKPRTDGDVLGAFKSSGLPDYFGMPVDLPSDVGSDFPYLSDDRVSVLPFRAYQLIYNEYFRDQNLQEEIPINLGSGDMSLDPHVAELLKLRNKCWEKDYFTSALPWTQRGGDVMLPMTGDAEVKFQSTDAWGANLRDPYTGALLNGYPDGDLRNVVGGMSTQTPEGSTPAAYDPAGTLYADLSEVNSATINELRKASRLQEWLERNARAGSRYIEQILSHFGVKSSDARLQRPEYLGGGVTPVNISEVLQTSSSDETSPQANMSGHGLSYGRSNNFKRFFEEHGQVIGLMCVLPRTAYQQGLERQYFKFDKFDFFFPEFAHLGEQPVYNREIYQQGRTSSYDNMGTFGYQSRYCEYKYIPSRVAGDFKTTLNFWHMGRIFDPSTPPVLNASFVEAKPTDRIFAVTDDKTSTDSLYIQIYNRVTAVRPMPRFGTPRL